MRLRTESGQGRVRGLLTRGREAGKEVKRNRVVVGDDVLTLSADSSVVSSILVAAVAAVAAVLQVFPLFDFKMEPPRVGVRASDERNTEFSTKLSPLAVVIGVFAEADTSKEGVVASTLRMGDLRCAKGARRLLTADPGVGLPIFLIADPGGLRGLPGVLEGTAADDNADK